MTNNPKYYLLNDNELLGIIFEDSKYGRTLVINNKLNPMDRIIKIYEMINGSSEEVKEIDYIEFIQSMIP